MEDKIEEAIEELTGKSKSAADSTEAMKFGQAVLSLTHALLNLEKLNKED